MKRKLILAATYDDNYAKRVDNDQSQPLSCSCVLLLTSTCLLEYSLHYREDKGQEEEKSSSPNLLALENVGEAGVELWKMREILRNLCNKIANMKPILNLNITFLF